MPQRDRIFDIADGKPYRLVGVALEASRSHPLTEGGQAFRRMRICDDLAGEFRDWRKSPRKKWEIASM